MSAYFALNSLLASLFCGSHLRLNVTNLICVCVTHLVACRFGFASGPHVDGDDNHWTLVCWIPVFNPNTSSDKDPILADKGFDMLGGQFTFRDFQVCLDLHHVLGVTMCVFRSRDYTHQTLPGASRSGRYTRIGFSCQMSEAMSNAVVAHINGTAPSLDVAGQQQQILNAQKKL